MTKSAAELAEENAALHRMKQRPDPGAELNSLLEPSRTTEETSEEWERGFEPTTPLDQPPLLSGKAWQILQHLGRDEPVFILRAKDILSTMSIMHYLTLIESYTPYSAMVESLTEVLDEFRAWQQENPAKVKLPDL